MAALGTFKLHLKGLRKIVTSLLSLCPSRFVGIFSRRSSVGKVYKYSFVLLTKITTKEQETNLPGEKKKPPKLEGVIPRAPPFPVPVPIPPASFPRRRHSPAVIAGGRSLVGSVVVVWSPVPSLLVLLVAVAVLIHRRSHPVMSRVVVMAMLQAPVIPVVRASSFKLWLG